MESLKERFERVCFVRTVVCGYLWSRCHIARLGPAPIGVHCLSCSCNEFPSSAILGQPISSCSPILHQLTMSSIHSLRGLPLLFVLSTIPNISGFNFLLSSILHMYTKHETCTQCFADIATCQVDPNRPTRLIHAGAMPTYNSTKPVLN